MKLTEVQKKLVEDNHNLIYWYANFKGLNLDDWYDLLAIELCKTIMKYNPEKGGVATYFKIRCDSLYKQQMRKSTSLKRGHIIGGDFIDEEQDNGELSTQEKYELKELLEVENGEILKLKLAGYTQKEIARELNVSQSFVSKAIQKMKDDYYDYD